MVSSTESRLIVEIRSAPGGAGTSIAVIAAHPDDIESWCAGTLALAIDQGATARLLLVTSGDKGSNESADTSQKSYKLVF